MLSREMYLLMLRYLYGITEAVVQSSCLKIHRKTPVLECLFKKVEDLRPATLLKRHSSTGVFP